MSRLEDEATQRGSLLREKGDFDGAIALLGGHCHRGSDAPRMSAHTQ
jgi:hypothetical protein